MSNSMSSSGVNVSDEGLDLDLSESEFVEADMKAHNVGKERERMYESVKQVLAQSEHWKNHRNPTRFTASSSIVSSSSDEPTIDLNKPSNQYNFNPTEITGRSTATNDASMSVEQILGESQCSDIRALAGELKMFKIRESCGGEQLAYTADVSLTSSKSFRSSMSRPDDWDINNQNGVDMGDVFMPSDRVKDFLQNEEHIWAQEYATLPPEPDYLNVDNMKKKPLELSDFSRYRLANESENESNASFGQFFLKRSENLCEMLPNTSPTKTGRPLALIDSVNTTQDNLTNGDNTKIIAASALPRNATSSNEGESFISHAAIQSFFQKCQNYSPTTVSSNLMNLKKPKAVVSKTMTSSAVKPAPEVRSVIDQLPLKALSTNKNVNILKDEIFLGNVAALKDHLSNQPIPIRNALLTPGGHLRRTDFNKENELNVRYEHEIDQHNLSSDTLSMSGLLSSSKVQGNSTKTSREGDFVNSVPVINSIETENGATGATNSDITSTNSSMRNRKRTRSNDPANCTPPKTASALDVYYNSKHRLTPSPNRTPPKTASALDVYYNSKHRLTPSPRTQSNSSTPDTPKSTPPKTTNGLDVYYNSKHRLAPSSTSSTPGTPRSKTNLDVLYDRSHRLTPSPNGSKNHTTESTNSTPVSSLHNGLHSSHSTNFLGPSNSNMRNVDANIRSPRLLAQSNSQFSSVSDLRDFAIKSSQSVISWPSQKLRTPSMKQFTIKNIGGKKLTMKIEVIGPGFQLSPSEPFQLIALQAQECRTISVTFCPIALGAAIGKLNFCHAKDMADKTIRKMIPLFGYGGHTVVEVQDVSQGVVGNPFLQLGTIGDLLNLQMCGSFSVYNKGPLRGVAIIRVKSDLKKPTGSSHYAAFSITPSKCVIGPDSHARIDIVYRPRKNDVRKLLRQEGNVLAVATLEVFMADEPSRQRILGLINKFEKNSSDIYLLDELFRGISTDVVENFAEFQETEEMIAELFNKMKSQEIVLTVKRSTMDQTIESEHDFFMSDTNESMFFHTLVSDDVCAPPVPAMLAPTRTIAATNIQPSSSALHNPVHRMERIQADNWYLNKAEIRLNLHHVDGAKSQIQICSKSRRQQIFEIYSNYPQLFVIEPDCGVISPAAIATVNVSIKNTTLPGDAYIRIRVDKKQDAVVPVIIEN